MNIKHLLCIFLLGLTFYTVRAQIGEPPNSLAGFIELRTATPPLYALPCNEVTAAFPTVNLGETTSRDYIIRNSGESRLYLYEFEILGSSAFSVSSEVTPDGSELVWLNPDQDLVITIHFAPTTAGDHEGKLLIHSSDPFTNPCGMGLEGEGHELLPGTLRIREEGSSVLYDCGFLSAITFVDVPVGTSATRTFHLENIGDGTLYFYEMGLDGPDYYSYSLNFPYTGQPYPIPPGESVSFDITFSPTEPGDDEALIKIITSDSNSEACTFDVEGQAVELESGTLRLRQEDDNYLYDCNTLYSVTFADVLVGESLTKTYFLENTGDEALYFYGMNMNGSDEFSIVYNFPFNGTSYAIPPGEGVSFDIVYAPINIGRDRPTLEISTSDPAASDCSFLLDGTAQSFDEGVLQSRQVGSGVPLYCGQTTSLEFADLPVGESQTRNYSIKNIGDGPLFLYGFNFTGYPNFFLNYDIPFENGAYLLEPGELVYYSITFTPDSPGEKRGAFSINSSDAGNMPCTMELEGGGLDVDAPHLQIITPSGDPLACGDTFYIDLSDTQPGPGNYLTYLLFRNYGTNYLEISGEVSVLGQPDIVHSFTISQGQTLQWRFLYTELELPGDAVTTLVYQIETNDPDQPFCTVYVEINQVIPGAKPPSNEKGARILRVGEEIKKRGRTAGSRIATADEANADFRLYPTVATSRLMLESTDADVRTYHIVNGVGQSVMSGQIASWESRQLTVDRLPAGMYYLIIEGENTTLRFVKN